MKEKPNTNTHIMVFERCEKKYLLTRYQYEQLRHRWENKQIEDVYGETSICNIYYDTEDYRLIRTSLEKPVYKEKFRVRSYGIPTKDSPVFLEIKKKVDGIVYKRRVEMTYEEAKEFLAHPNQIQSNNQITKEIQYMFQMYQLAPKMYVAYDRIATYNSEDPLLRITFDFNLRSRETNLDIGAEDVGKPLFDKDMVLMEVKANQAMPLWMVKDLEELDISPVSFSKYGIFYKKKVLNENKEKSKLSTNTERMFNLCFQV